MDCYGGDICGDAAVYAEELIVDDGGERQMIEKIHNEVVHLLVVLDKT